MATDVFAFEFSCPMTLEQVRLAFEASGIGEWILRDSHWWGATRLECTSS